jgi:hypothetical protein
MEEDLLANVDREAVKSDLLLRPRVATTADRHGISGDLQHELVYFDWQQHWSSVKMLFQRTDVRYSACQHVQGRHRCKYCTEYWFETQKATRWDHQPFWPPLETDGCQGKVFPLLLDHDGQDIGGDGSAKTDLALSIMPDAMADRLIQEQLDELDELEGDDEDEDGFEADFDVMAKYQDKCKAWLATELDDARLLFSGYSLWHRGLMPLTVRLAQLLAPPGAILELRVTPRPSTPGVMRATGVSRGTPSCVAKEAWESAAVVDVTNQIVYTLDAAYFSAQCKPAHQFIEGKETVRRWLKDGGIPFAAYCWLRRRLPLELMREIQAQLLGRDVMPIPKWLDYADATATNWLPPRRLSYLQEAWSPHDCLCKCHPAEGHIALCDTYRTMDAELVSQFGELMTHPMATSKRAESRVQLEKAHALLSTRLDEVTTDLQTCVRRACASLAAALQQHDEQEAQADSSRKRGRNQMLGT